MHEVYSYLDVSLVAHMLYVEIIMSMNLTMKAQEIDKTVFCHVHM